MTPQIMDIPYQAIPSATLRNMIEELITRDGTDYGAAEMTLDEKVAQVMQKLVNGEAVIRYDELLEVSELVLINAC